MSASTDTSSIALEGALLHLVLNQAAQERLYKEIIGMVETEKEKKITDMEGMSYLSAVVKEMLQRHPPSHFMLSHVGTREMELRVCRILAEASMEFYTAWVTEDPSMWEKAEEWWPEWFEEGSEGWETDVMGMRVRMMPFGAGRRIYPATMLGLLHVQLMLARMVGEFQWVAGLEHEHEVAGGMGGGLQWRRSAAV